MKYKDVFYFDYNATVPVTKNVLDSMLPYFNEDFGNPSANYELGINSKIAIERSRKLVSDFIGTNPSNIIFTSGATEANNTIIKNLTSIKREKGHIITSLIEHPSILETIKFLERNFKYKVTYLKPNSSGIINLEELSNAICEDTLMVALMYVNNETGSINPIKKIGDICSTHNIHFHCDAVQAFGKLDLNVSNIKCDSLSLSAHKVGGPKGIGILYINSEVNLLPLLHGGGQEFDSRSGTENVPYIVGLGQSVINISQKTNQQYLNHYQNLRNHFIEKMNQSPIKWSFNLTGHNIYPSTINICFSGVNNNALISILSKFKIYVGNGSACSSKKDSFILKNIGLNDLSIKSSIRISFGGQTTTEEIDYLVEKLNEVVPLLLNQRGRVINA